MTDREYFEVVTVEQARYAAHVGIRAIGLPDGRDGLRYLWYLDDELDRRGIRAETTGHE